MSYGTGKSQISNLPETIFGETLTGELNPQFQISFEYTVDNTEITTNTKTNSGTITQADAMAVINSGATTASEAMIKSKRHAKYKSGMGGEARFTALFDTPKDATVQLIGLAGEKGSSTFFKNGIMIGYAGTTTFGLHLFANDIKTTIPLSAWDDPLDGSGNSGMNITETNIGVFSIPFQYLGAGAVQIRIENPETGKYFTAHTVQYANNNVVPSSYNPNYHMTAFVDNLATTANLTMKTASWAYFVQGKTKYTELQQPQFSSGKKEKLVVTSEVAIFTIRNKTTYASKTNFIDLILQNIGASIEASSANNLGQVRLVRNATLGGTPIFADINTTDSIVEIDTAGTTVTGGKELFIGSLAGKNDKADKNLAEFEIILAPGETITLAGESVNSATFDGNLLWRELF